MSTLSDIKNLYKSNLSSLYDDREIKTIFIELVGRYTNASPIDIYTNPAFVVSKLAEEKLNSALDRLIKQEPIDYIVGDKMFCGYKFSLNSSVLIPRPETEELVHIISNDFIGKNVNVLDIGTGSGCIAITLSKLLPQAIVSACDISVDALKMAKKNADQNHCSTTFFTWDVFDKQSEPKAMWDVIVSNPPYVTESEKTSMQAQVSDYEPSSALFVGDADPLIFYRTISKYAMKHLTQNGCLYFEINENFGADTCKLLVSLGFQAKLYKDSFGKDRIVKAFF